MDKGNQTLSSYIYRADFVQKSEIGNLSKIAYAWYGSCLAMAIRVLSSMSLQEKEIHNQFVWILLNQFACIQMMI
jgi:hypothetical protein